MKTVTFAAMALALSLAGCSETTEPTPEAATVRTAIGKADLSGSCAATSGNHCGGPSDGNCWCDELCSAIGDCCGDRVAVCETGEPAACEGGQVQTTMTFAAASNGMECATPKDHCVTLDSGACPLLSPLPPGYCADGELVSGPNSYISSSDGKECAMPSVHCLTRDFGACPQLNPLPPDYCADGQVVKGASSFIASSDDMECEMPSMHCVAADSAACPE